MKRRFRNARQKLAAYLFRPTAEGFRPLPWHAELLRFAVMTARTFGRNHLFMRSGAMAFISTIAVFPLAAVLLIFLPLIFSPHEIRRQAALAETTGTTVIVAVPDVAADYASQVGGMLVDAIAPAGAGKGWSESMAHLFREYRSRAEEFGALGIIGLFLGALALYQTTQQSFNSIWKAKRSRGRLQSLAVFSGVLVWIPLLVFISIYIRNRAMVIGPHVGASVSLLTSAAFTFIFFAALYRYLPTVEVRWRSAMLGAVIATVLWTWAKGSFAAYVSHDRNLSNLFRTVGTVPYFLVWMYVSWVVLLLGAVISYTHQNYHSLVTIETEEKVIVTDPIVLVLLLYVIGKNFMEEGGGVSFNALRDICPIPQSLLNSHMTYLEEHRYICQRAEEDFYILQRPPDRIYMRDFFLSGHRAEGLALSDQDLKHELLAFLKSLDEAVTDYLREMTLDGLVTRLQTEPAQVINRTDL
jgi:membrane protein